MTKAKAKVITTVYDGEEWTLYYSPITVGDLKAILAQDSQQEQGLMVVKKFTEAWCYGCLLYTSPSPRDS